MGFKKFFGIGEIFGIKDPQAAAAMSTALLVSAGIRGDGVWPTY